MCRFPWFLAPGADITADAQVGDALGASAAGDAPCRRSRGLIDVEALGCRELPPSADIVDGPDVVVYLSDRCSALLWALTTVAAGAALLAFLIRAGRPFSTDLVPPLRTGFDKRKRDGPVFRLCDPGWISRPGRCVHSCFYIVRVLHLCCVGQMKTAP